jgi:dimethylargininase
MLDVSMKNVTTAITREVSPLILNCELTHLQREPIDFKRAQSQHQEYCKVLKVLGLHVVILPHDSFPDGVFVEDPAIVFEELAIITRMGVASRQAEVESLARVLGLHRKLEFIEAPGTLEGGDVLRIGKTVYVGISGRSNLAGIEQMKRILAPHGYRVVTSPTMDCLHFKSACSYLGRNTVLIHPKWVEAKLFQGCEVIEIHPEEIWAANALWINDTILYPAIYPRTLERMAKAGFEMRVVDNSELIKAESALTCMSQIF